jgi:hypothetical protein
VSHLSDVVSQQRTALAATAVHHQNPALAWLLKGLWHQQQQQQQQQQQESKLLQVCC